MERSPLKVIARHETGNVSRDLSRTAQSEIAGRLLAESTLHPAALDA
jgi:hypothetical protein